MDTEDEDIIQNETGEVEGTGNEERLARLNAIADQSENERVEELANVNDDDTTEPFREKTAEVEEATEQSEQVQESAPSVVKHKIKVNGKELELTTEELIARAQKVESADEYLRQAKNSVVQQETARPSKEELQRQQDEEDRALVRAIQMGSEEEAAAAIRKIREASRTAPSISPDDVSRTIDERLSFNEAVKWFRSEYSDITSNPRLEALAQQRDEELVRQGDTRSYQERYQAIGEELRGWVKEIAPKPAQPVEDMTAREEKKAAAPKPVKQASVKVQQAKEADEEPDDSPGAVISRMRQHRGGPQWMRT